MKSFLGLQMLNDSEIRIMDRLIKDCIDCGAARVLEATLRANTRRVTQGGGRSASGLAALHCRQVCLGCSILAGLATLHACLKLRLIFTQPACCRLAVYPCWAPHVITWGTIAGVKQQLMVLGVCWRCRRRGWPF